MKKELILCLIAVLTIVSTVTFDQVCGDTAPTIVAQAVNRYNLNNAGEHATWQKGQVVTVAADPSDNQATKRAINTAIANWNQAGVVKLQPTNDVTNADIRVINRPLSDPGNIVFGLTNISCRDNNSRIASAVISINSQAINKHHKEDHKSIQDYTNMVCTHEMGHALGLSHTTPGTNSVMQPGTDRNIQSYDIQHIQNLYKGND